jgi:hypothetical protein
MECSSGPLAIVTNSTCAPNFPMSSPLSTLSTGSTAEAVAGITLGGLTFASALWLLSSRQARRDEKSSTTRRLAKTTHAHIHTPNPASVAVVWEVELFRRQILPKSPRYIVQPCAPTKGRNSKTANDPAPHFAGVQLTYFGVVILACRRPIVLPGLPQITGQKSSRLSSSMYGRHSRSFPYGRSRPMSLSHSYEGNRAGIWHDGSGFRPNHRARRSGRGLFASSASWAFRLTLQRNARTVPAFPASIAALALGMFCVDTFFVEVQHLRRSSGDRDGQIRARSIWRHVAGPFGIRWIPRISGNNGQ